MLTCNKLIDFPQFLEMIEYLAALHSNPTAFSGRSVTVDQGDDRYTV